MICKCFPYSNNCVVGLLFSTQMQSFPQYNLHLDINHHNLVHLAIDYFFEDFEYNFDFYYFDRLSFFTSC